MRRDERAAAVLLNETRRMVEAAERVRLVSLAIAKRAGVTEWEPPVSCHGEAHRPVTRIPAGSRYSES